MELLALLALAAVMVTVVRISRWARANREPLYGLEDPETGISEEEWMDAIK